MTAPHGRSGDGSVSEALETSSRIVAAWLRRQMATNPYATLGAGAVAGYVLGGGLSPRVGSLVVRGATRAMLADMAGAVVRGIADGADGAA